MLVNEQSQKYELVTFLVVAPTSVATTTLRGKGLFGLIVRGDNISCQEKWRQNQEWLVTSHPQSGSRER